MDYLAIDCVASSVCTTEHWVCLKGNIDSSKVGNSSAHFVLLCVWKLCTSNLQNIPQKKKKDFKRNDELFALLQINLIKRKKTAFG